MARPNFTTAWNAYPHPRRLKKISQPELLRSLGWDEFIGNPNYEDTCAIRISVCLHACGVPVTSSVGMRALAGPHANKPIEILQVEMQKHLTNIWGRADVVAEGRNAEEQIRGRDGIISFSGIPGYHGGRGGHVDVVDGSRTTTSTGMLWWRRDVIENAYACGTNCYFNVNSVHFWELPR